MIFSNKISDPKFLAKVEDVADRLNIKSDWLMAVMFFESRIQSSAINPKSNAVGLIQFMPSTLKDWGLSSETVKGMTPANQMNLVEKYLNPYKGKIKSFTDLYLAVFFPKAIGKGKGYVLETDNLKASRIATQNSGFDTNKNKKITVGEIENFHKDFFAKHLNTSELSVLFSKNIIVPVIIAVVAGGFLYYILKHQKTKK